MKKAVSKILAFAMAAVMTFSISPALTAEAANKTLPAETLYMTSKSNGYTSFQIDKLTKVDDVKSSNMAVLKPSGYSIHKSSYEYFYYSDSNKKFTKSDSASGSKYTDFSFYAYKKGTSTVTIKSGSTTYNKKINVEKYVNPLKSLTISNVNGGKNIAGKYKSEARVRVTGKKADTIKVKATAASNWEITEISISNTDYSTGRSIGSYSNRYFKNGTTSGVNILNFYDSGKADVYVYCVNKKNGGKISINAEINYPKTNY